MKQAFPPYKFSELPDSGIDQLEEFENIFDAAEAGGVITCVPQSESATYDIQTQRVRIQTIATRLYLLGYLRDKIPPKKLNKKIQDIQLAVQKFQGDAGLKIDNWVGDKTWYALDELVSFESTLSSELWFCNGLIKPEATYAVYRAIQLRLWSLGLYQHKPKENFKLPEIGMLDNFGRICKVFLLQENNFKVAFDQESIELLFDQDKLTDVLVTQSNKDLSNWELRFSDNKTDCSNEQELAEAFIVNCAKVELWLLGYKVSIDGDPNFSYERYSPIYNAISLYYQQFEGLSKSSASKLAGKITPRLFQGMVESQNGADNYNSDDASEEIAQAVNSNEKVNEAWNYVQDKGISLWDGLKRIWRWIKKIGGKVLSFADPILFKGFFRYATKAYKIIKSGIAAVVDSIYVYIKGHMEQSGAYFSFSKDMDTIALLDGTMSEADVSAAINRLSRQGNAFNIGCRILAFIIDVIKATASGVVGWARFLVALVRGYQEILVFYTDFKAIAA